MVTVATITTAITYLHVNNQISFQQVIPTIVRPIASRKKSQLTDFSKQSYPCQTLSGFSKLTICPGDVIPEIEALSFPSCADENLAADAGKSTISLRGGRSRYKQGEIISILITLHDGYGRRKSVGGDHLRVRILGDGGMSAVTGTVFDHDNGSYTAQFEALFSGKITPDVVLAYTRETITSNYGIRTTIKGTTNIHAEFVNGDISEETSCHTIPYWLSNYTELCNLTMENSGMPWYCGKPVHRNLLCADWVKIKPEKPIAVLPITSAERKLMKRPRASIPNNISITVDAMAPNALIAFTRRVPCKEYNRTELWYKREATGFIRKGRWTLRHCQAKSLPYFKTCVQHKTILLFGDSTTRQWLEDLHQRFGCNVISEMWSKTRKWHKRAKCVNTGLNLTAEWLPHSQPFFLGTDLSRYTTHSISRHLDEDIKDDDNVIVLLHMFTHVLPFRHDVFQTKIRIIRQSVERLLARNKFATVFIKGAHTFRHGPHDGSRWPDYFGYLYWNIMFHEFAGLYDKVVYLDNKDITNALQVVPNHPPQRIVSAMVDQMFSYMC